NLRQYTMTIRAFPFARSQTEVKADALGSGSMTEAPTLVEETISDGSSATGWTGAWAREVGSPAGSYSGSLSPFASVDTFIIGQAPGSNPPSESSVVTTISLTWTGSQDVSTTKQI